MPLTLKVDVLVDDLQNDHVVCCLQNKISAVIQELTQAAQSNWLFPCEGNGLYNQTCTQSKQATDMKNSSEHVSMHG